MGMKQQEFSFFSTAVDPGRFDTEELEGKEWITGKMPWRGQMYAYLIMVRAPEDEEPARKGDPQWWRAWKKQNDMGTLRERILSTLMQASSVGITFNHICVAIAGTTADVLGGTAMEDALWSLVVTGDVEFFNQTPIRFRVTAKDEASGR